MKKILLAFLAATSVAWGQGKNLYLNAQLHYDFDREIATSTLEFFHLDKLGTTFFFTDFDFDEVGQHGSYFEISRNLRIVPSSRGNLNVSVQYNDGTLDVPEKVVPGAFLYGLAFDNLHVGPARLEFQTLARKEFATRVSWQLTLVWFTPVQPWLLFNGYVDVNGDQRFGGRTRVQSEPQLRFYWQPWSLGSELEVSRNFLPAGTARQPFKADKWFAHPTIFLQYDF
jgi:hypothetical protein